MQAQLVSRLLGPGYDTVELGLVNTQNSTSAPTGASETRHLRKAPSPRAVVRGKANQHPECTGLSFSL